MTGSGHHRGEQAPSERYSAEQFSFVEDRNEGDVLNWLTFAETRTERREERRRRSKVKLVAAGALAGVLVVVLGGVVLTRVLGGDEASATATAGSVLFQIRGDDGQAVASALLVRDDDGGSVMVLVPGEVIVGVPGEGPRPLAEALADVGPALSRAALADLLGVRIDGSWVVDEPSFALLIDALGGVEVEVSEDVISDGEVVVPAGDARRLDGQAALAFAARGEDGDHTDQVPRVESLLRGILAKLPSGEQAVFDVIDNIGVVPGQTMAHERLAALLTAIAVDAEASRLEAGALPIKAVGEDGAGPLDVAEAVPLIEDLLGGAARVQRSDGPPRVLVLNGTNSKEWVDDVRVKLSNAGYHFIDGGEAEDSHPESEVVIPDGSDDARQAAVEVALTLDLSDSAVHVDDSQASIADITVIIGEDYKPSS